VQAVFVKVTLELVDSVVIGDNLLSQLNVSGQQGFSTAGDSRFDSLAHLNESVTNLVHVLDKDLPHHGRSRFLCNAVGGAARMFAVSYQDTIMATVARTGGLGA
jgi:hypothetical protein